MDLRSNIVEVARKEFCKTGFEKTRVQTIADQVGVTSNIIYNIFQSKARLFDVLVRESVDLFTQFVEKGISRGIKSIVLDPSNQKGECPECNDLYVAELLTIYNKDKDAIALAFIHGNGSGYDDWKQNLILRITQILKVYYNTHVGKLDIVNSSILNILCENCINQLVRGFTFSFSNKEFSIYIHKTLDSFVQDFIYVCITTCSNK